MIDRGLQFSHQLPQTAGADRVTSDVRSSGQALRNQAQHLVSGDLLRVQQLLRKATGSRFDVVQRLSEHALALGGKQLRPTLALLAARAVAGPEGLPDSQQGLPDGQHSDLLAAAAAVELVHTASLVHDDVMDDAQTRRHQPSVGRVAGTHAAVLSGDFLFTRAYGLAAKCRSGYAARQLARASTALCEGELRQQAAVECWELTTAEYRSVLRQKTGALCGVSCLLGGWAAGAASSTLRALRRYGAELGVAFQIVDDWLDYWGTEEVGKTLGTDLAQRKPTLPLLRALRTGTDANRRQLRVALEVQGPPDLDTVRTLIERSDAEQYTLAMARRCVTSATDALTILPDSAAKNALLAVAQFSVQRSA